MARKDITDLQVVQAYHNYKLHGERPFDYLVRTTNQPDKVCWRAMERACNHKLVDYGTGLNTGWLTQKGKELLNNERSRGQS